MRQLLLKKNKDIKKQQLSNIKAHLYKQILASLRIIRDENNIDIQLHEQMDHARILYNKGLYLQSLKAAGQDERDGQEHITSLLICNRYYFLKKRSKHLSLPAVCGTGPIN